MAEHDRLAVAQALERAKVQHIRLAGRARLLIACYQAFGARWQQFQLCIDLGRFGLAISESEACLRCRPWSLFEGSLSQFQLGD